MVNISDKVWTNSNISVMTIGSFYCTSFLVLIIYNYFTWNKKKNIKLIIISSTMIHIISWLVHFICSMTTYINTNSNLHDNHDIANYIICAMIIIHPITFYISIISRLYHSFQTTNQKLTLPQFITIFIGVCTVITARFIEQTSWILIIHGNTPIININKLLTCLWTFISADIATRLLLIYLFAHKLYLIVVMNNEPAEIDAKNVLQNTQKMQLLLFIKKIVILGICATLPMTIASIVYVINFIIVNGFFTHENWIIYNTLQTFAVFIELLAMILAFKFNENIYFMFCKCSLKIGNTDMGSTKNNSKSYSSTNGVTNTTTYSIESVKNDKNNENESSNTQKEVNYNKTFASNTALPMNKLQNKFTTNNMISLETDSGTTTL
eukprot:429408_1